MKKLVTLGVGQSIKIGDTTVKIHTHNVGSYPGSALPRVESVLEVERPDDGAPDQQA